MERSIQLTGTNARLLDHINLWLLVELKNALVAASAYVSLVAQNPEAGVLEVPATDMGWKK